MTEKITINKINEVYCHIAASDEGILEEIDSFLKFRPKGFQYTPAFRNKVWNGWVRLYNRANHQIYLGLVQHVQDFAKERGYTVELDPEIQANPGPINLETFIESLNLPFELRQYQYDAIYHAIKNERSVLLSPTASGKSAIIYGIIRYYSKKTLLVVPSTNLCLQMLNDFKKYSENDSWNADANCHIIMAGRPKESNKKIFCSTWQSLYKMPAKYFEQFEVVINDECHSAKSECLKGILQKCTKVKYRFGTTATLSNDCKVHSLVIQGLIGPAFQVTTTAALIDQKFLADLKINCIVLEYPDEVKKAAKELNYHEEIDLITNYEPRNKFLANLACSTKSNTLVLFFHLTQGKAIYELIQKKLEGTKRNAFFVSGATAADTREQIRQIVEKQADAIIVGSIVFSTGTDIPSLEHIIFAHPAKSRIRTLQSIGRSLRLGRTGKATLYDVVDGLCWKNHKNYAMKHFLERVKIYLSEKFSYKMYQVPLSKEKGVDLACEKV